MRSYVRPVSTMPATSLRTLAFQSFFALKANAQAWDAASRADAWYHRPEIASATG